MCVIRESYVIYDANIYIYIYYTLCFLEIVSICIYIYTYNSLLGCCKFEAPSTVGSDISILLAVNCDVLRWFETGSFPKNYTPVN